MAAVQNFLAKDTNFSLNSMGPSSLTSNNLTKETHIRLKKRYLPELRNLYTDCNWLRTNLSIDGSRALQPNEIKLLQFIALLDAIIKELASLSEDFQRHDLRELQSLESRIVKTVLPVKNRLHERWSQQKKEDNSGPFAQSKYSNGNNTAPNATAEASSAVPPAASGMVTPPMPHHHNQQQQQQYQTNDDSGSVKSGSFDNASESSSATTASAQSSSISSSSLLSNRSASAAANNHNKHYTASPTSISHSYSRNISAATSSDMTSSSSSQSSGIADPKGSLSLPVSQQAATQQQQQVQYQQQQVSQQQASQQQAQQSQQYNTYRPIVKEEPLYTNNDNNNNNYNNSNNNNHNNKLYPMVDNKKQQHYVPKGQLTIEATPEDFHPLAIKNEDGSFTQYFVIDGGSSAAPSLIQNPVYEHIVYGEAIANQEGGVAVAVDEVHENIFDNMPDCGIDLMEDDDEGNEGKGGLVSAGGELLLDDDMETMQMLGLGLLMGYHSSDLTMNNHTNSSSTVNSGNNSYQVGSGGSAGATVATTKGNGRNKRSFHTANENNNNNNNANNNNNNNKASSLSLTTIPSTNNIPTKPPGPYYSSAIDIDLKASLLAGSSAIREEEYMSSRRRRRLNQIVPNPRKPRTADYACSLCGEGYTKTVDANPWWAVYKHDCPHCKANMIPRIDISQANNAIELDPNVIALYGEGIEDSGDEGGEDFEYSDGEDDPNDVLGNDLMNLMQSMHAEMMMDEVDASFPSTAAGGNDEGMHYMNNNTSSVAMMGNGSEGAGGGNNGLMQVIEPMEEPPIFDGEGLLNKEEASKLLVLMCHARTCTGSHTSNKHAEVCRSTKFLMLHIRDCKGHDTQGRECLFPWCAPCKKMLKHLTQCYEPATCAVCNPWCLPESFQQLRKLNQMTPLCQPIAPSTGKKNSHHGSNSNSSGMMTMQSNPAITTMG